MTQRERLLKALFDHQGREHIDVKFFVDDAMDVSADELCASAANAFFQVDQGLIEGDSQFTETFKTTNVRELVASL